MTSGLLILFLKGLLIGFSIAAPIGPIGILCINNTLQKGFNYGIATGLGAAVADGLYGFAAAFGLAFVTSFLTNHEFCLQLLGGLFLLYLAGKTLFDNKSPAKTLKKNEKNIFQTFLITFFLTVINPITILAFIAIFAGIGLGTIHSGYFAASILALSIFLGSLIWWILLSGGVGFFHKKITPTIRNSINLVSALVIGLFGAVALIHLF